MTGTCQFELADVVIATKRSEHGDAARDAQDRTHLHRAIINADRCMLRSRPPAASRIAIDATEASAIFELNAERLKEPGIETSASI
jgi:hypothetical protein